MGGMGIMGPGSGGGGGILTGGRPLGSFPLYCLKTLIYVT